MERNLWKKLAWTFVLKLFLLLGLWWFFVSGYKVSVDSVVMSQHLLAEPESSHPAPAGVSGGQQRE